MSFFNLTTYGPQNKLGAYKLESGDKTNQTGQSNKKNVKDPNQIYKQPVTCAQQIGWWTKDQDSLEWAKVKKHVFPKSEMTSFADKMSLADKSFRMF